MQFLEKIKEGIGPNLLILGILIWFSGYGRNTKNGARYLFSRSIY